MPRPQPHLHLPDARLLMAMAEHPAGLWCNLHGHMCTSDSSTVILHKLCLVACGGPWHPHRFTSSRSTKCNAGSSCAVSCVQQSTSQFCSCEQWPAAAALNGSSDAVSVCPELEEQHERKADLDQGGESVRRCHRKLPGCLQLLLKRLLPHLLQDRLQLRLLAPAGTQVR